MKRTTGLLAILFLGISILTNSAIAQSRQRLSMDLGWKFKLGDFPDAKKAGYNDHNWRTLNLPHDWGIEGTFKKDAPGGGSAGYLPSGIGWYRKHFTVPERLLNREVKILFDGVYMNSDVWINGHHLGNHPYGYTPFYYNLTPFLKKGENVIAVRVDNSRQPNTRWYSGSGIYRNVWMITTDSLHIAHYGVYVTTPVATADSGVVRIQTTISNDLAGAQKGTLTSVLLDANNKVVARASKDFLVNGGKTTKIAVQVPVDKPHLWSLQTPYLYTLRSTIVRNGEKVDEMVTPFGIRRIRYDTNRGFFLNGKHIKMKGVCLHQGGGVVGAAVPAGVWERRLKELKEMGVNAVRTAHNPPAPEFLDLCDRLGLLVMDEAFDTWTVGKRKYGYQKYFDEWGTRDLAAMILRDRNHPSIVLWSVGNEIPEQSMNKGAAIARKLVDICHRLDPTRPVTSACDKIADDSNPTKPAFMKQLDIVGYNYADRWHKRRELFYAPDKIAFPNRKMIGTEAVSIHGIRGYYSLGRDPNEVHPNYNFNMIRSEQLWKFIDTHDYVIGYFIWTGIDYLGESFWPNVNASSGALDLCGFKKDAFYFYQSLWTDKPVLHLFPHWNWSRRLSGEGQIIPVLAYTNCDTVSLYLNGKFYGEKRISFPRQGTSGGWNHYDRPRVLPTTGDLHLEWDVPYEPGVLKAVGKKDGKTIIEEVRTTGAPAAIRLSVDKSRIVANGRDVTHIKVEIVDKAGNVVPTADNLITFDLKGPARIIGVGNGNPRDHESHKASRQKAFNGLCLAILQSTRSIDRPGTIHIQAHSEGLKGAVAVVHTTPDPDKAYYWEDVYGTDD